MATIDSTTEALFALANDALSRAQSATGRMAEFIPSINKPYLNYSATKPTIAKPTALSDMLTNDDSSATLAWLDGEAEKWLDQFFPELQATLKSEPEKWLVEIITGAKPFGLSEDVFRAIWHQARDREYRARNSATAQIRAEFSMRGFSLPPGAMVAAITQAEQASSDAIAGVNIAQAIRDSEIKLDLLKFAEEQAIRLKFGIFQALADFYRMWVNLPDKSVEQSRLKVAAYQSLNAALSDYYRVDLGWEELRLRAAEAKMGGTVEHNRAKVATLDGSRNQGLGQAVRAFGDIASSAASAASTLVAEIETA